MTHTTHRTDGHPSRRVCLWLLAGCALSACVPRAGEDGLDHFRQDARVEFRIRPDGEWQPGYVGTLRDKCLAIFAPTPPPPLPPRRFTPVPFHSLSSLRVSRNAEGASGPGGQPEGDPMDRSGADEWIELSVAEVRRRHGACDPFE